MRRRGNTEVKTAEREPTSTIPGIALLSEAKSSSLCLRNVTPIRHLTRAENKQSSKLGHVSQSTGTRRRKWESSVDFKVLVGGQSRKNIPDEDRGFDRPLAAAVKDTSRGARHHGQVRIL